VGGEALIFVKPQADPRPSRPFSLPVFISYNKKNTREIREQIEYIYFEIYPEVNQGGAMEIMP